MNGQKESNVDFVDSELKALLPPERYRTLGNTGVIERVQWHLRLLNFMESVESHILIGSAGHETIARLHSQVLVNVDTDLTIMIRALSLSSYITDQ